MAERFLYTIVLTLKCYDVMVFTKRNTNILYVNTFMGERANSRPMSSPPRNPQTREPDNCSPDNSVFFFS